MFHPGSHLQIDRCAPLIATYLLPPIPDLAPSSTTHTSTMAFKFIALALGVSAVNAMPTPLSFEDAVAVRAALPRLRSFTCACVRRANSAETRSARSEAGLLDDELLLPGCEALPHPDRAAESMLRHGAVRHRRDLLPAHQNVCPRRPRVHPA